MKVYFKLMLRGLTRYKKKGKRFFVLLVLCFIAVIFGLNFTNSFSKRYENLGYDAYAPHLQIISSQSSLAKNNSKFEFDDQNVPLISVDKRLDDFVKSLPGVEASAPIIEKVGFFSFLNGRYNGFAFVKGVNPSDLTKVLPGVRFVNENRDFAWDGTSADIPVLRQKLEFYDESPDWIKRNYEIRRGDFYAAGDEFEKTKNRIAQDLSDLLGGKDFSGSGKDKIFIEALNGLLADNVLYEKIPEKFFEKYDYKIDDAITEIKSLPAVQADEMPKMNKKLLKALFFDDIGPVFDETRLNVPMTLSVNPTESSDSSGMPTMLPVKFVNYVETLPLYIPTSFIDIKALRQYLEIGEDHCTNYLIRLTDKKLTQDIKKKITGFLASGDYPGMTVIDYGATSKMYMPTAMAFSAIMWVLIALFLVMVIIFVVNNVMMAIVKRKSEIGTSITLGMSNGENVFVMLGEVFFITTFSWVVGSVFGMLLSLIFVFNGFPILFFQNGRFYFYFDLMPILVSYLLIMPIALASAAVPLTRLLKIRPVDLLKESK
jgi:ABC-type lipoprotein release transport system permease subunit